MRISDWSSDVCSSDLLQPVEHAALGGRLLALACRRRFRRWALRGRPEAVEHARSEEHTSELQSLMRISYAVFCLKKKKKKESTDKKQDNLYKQKVGTQLNNTHICGTTKQKHTH